MPKRVPTTGVRVLGVDPKGLASRAGLRPGDRLLRVNGQELRDLVDFHVQAGEEHLAIDVDRGGRPCSVVLERKWGRDLGLECEPPAPAEIATCANKCVFCFIHQLPHGMRKSLYVKDDDFRLSFLHGNYITLTDLPTARSTASSSSGCRRSTSPCTRPIPSCGTPSWGARRLRASSCRGCERLAKAGIRLHAQIVLCPGLNDGPHLERTVRELAPLHPHVNHRGDRPGRPHAPSRAAAPAAHRSRRRRRAPLDAIARLAARLPRAPRQPLRLPRRRALPAGAGSRCPPRRGLRGLPVAEDGIGLVRRFEDDLRRAASRPATASLARPARGHGRDRRAVRAAPRPRCSSGSACRGSGPTWSPCRTSSSAAAIAVAGLLTGQDIQRHSGRAGRWATRCWSRAWRCATATGVFLDDLTPADLARALGVPVVAVERARAGCSTASSTGRPRRRDGATSGAAPVIAIVGRPNVGKSTLFNRLVGTPAGARARHARRHPRPPLRPCEFERWQATVIDTGGFDPSSEEPLTAQVRRQVLAAIAEADASCSWWTGAPA